MDGLIGKGICEGYILSPCLFKSHAGHITQNAGLDESQAEIRIAGGNINSLRYAYDAALRAESEEELKSLLMNVKQESEEAGLNLNIHIAKILAAGPITS